MEGNVDERERVRHQRLLAEEFGLLFEEMGRTRMDGRVAAWLLVADPPVQSLTEIAKALGVSKAAVSSAARDLLQAEMVERVSEAGRRGDSYCSRAGELEGVLQLNHLQVFQRLVDRALALVADKDQTQSNYAQLHEMRDFLAFLEVEIPGLIARWQALRAAMPSQAATARPDDIPNRGGTR
jgi:DNA-binding transcriptional regulator GbsR (MarR family)